MQSVLTVIAAVCALLALAGAAYFALCAWAAGALSPAGGHMRIARTSHHR